MLAQPAHAGRLMPASATRTKKGSPALALAHYFLSRVGSYCPPREEEEEEEESSSVRLRAKIRPLKVPPRVRLGACACSRARRTCYRGLLACSHCSRATTLLLRTARRPRSPLIKRARFATRDCQETTATRHVAGSVRAPGPGIIVGTASAAHAPFACLRSLLPR